MRRVFSILVLMMVGWSVFPPVRGEVLPEMKETARELLHDGAPGVSMAVVVRGKVYFWSIGDSGRPGLRMTNETLFETASLTKVFTATLLGFDAARGVRPLSARLPRFMRGYRLRPRMRNATLEELATFRAGLPTAPPGFLKIPEKDRTTSAYSVADFLRYVSRFQPATTLPSQSAYGDASLGLLGLCLGSLRLTTWNDRLEKEVYRPLGMRDTTLYLTARQRDRLAIGKEPDGKSVAPWPIDALAAADGTKSTARDLGRFLLGLMGRVPGIPDDLSRGMFIATQTRVSIDGGNRFQALAWTWEPLDLDGQKDWVIAKTGGIPGFSTQLSFNPKLGIGVAILVNGAHIPVNDAAKDLIRTLASTSS